MPLDDRAGCWPPPQNNLGSLAPPIGLQLLLVLRACSHPLQRQRRLPDEVREAFDLYFLRLCGPHAEADGSFSPSRATAAVTFAHPDHLALIEWGLRQALLPIPNEPTHHQMAWLLWLRGPFLIMIALDLVVIAFEERP